MQFAKFAICIGSISSHHQIRDDFYIMFPQDKNITSIQSYGICNADKHARFFVFLYNIIPCAVRNNWS